MLAIAREGSGVRGEGGVSQEVSHRRAVQEPEVNSEMGIRKSVGGGETVACLGS